MLKISIYNYFEFGFNYNILNDNGMIGRDRNDSIDLLTRFLEHLDSLDLQVTKQIAAELPAIVDELRKSTDTIVTTDQSQRVKKIIDKLDSTLDAELQLKNAYVLTKKRYPLDTLLNSSAELLAANAAESLSDTSRRDFANACRQVALNQPTAAAFHLMRSLEEQVRRLYFAFKKTKRLEKPMWGPMTAQLRDKRPPKPSNKLLDHLDSMRVHFRNPTQHPDVFYSADESQDLLNQTITAINMIAAELPKTKS